MRLLIAGGGTGGHLFPGVAIAEALKARDPEADVLFVGTERGIEARVLEGLGWKLATINASGLKTVGLRSAIVGLLRIPRAMWQSRRIIKNFKPDAIVGVGGYASGPAVLTGWMMRKNTSILEQNSIPGLTNKILGRFVRAVFIAFDETRRFFKAKKLLMTGTPIRAQLRERLEGPDVTSQGPHNDLFHVFIFGGSQGAAAVNAVVAQAAAVLHAAGKPMAIVHQTGQRDLERTEKTYAAAGVPANCRAFIDDMAREYRRANLVIARSGAATVAELAAAGVPAILIPYPTAADNHQAINAREMVERGAALMLDQVDASPRILAEQLTKLMEEPDALERMRNAMTALGRPDAADRIVDWLINT